ncbi:hypothetical protein N9P07_05210 [Alphaproteobacteria bacterium]|nr:hypothetical protein [Alphaproteobacteria bacterium]
MRNLISVLFLASFFIGFIPAHFLNDEIISIDDTSYISHAMTFGLDLDFDYGNEVAIFFAENGKVPSHPYGIGVMSFPFVFVGGIIDYISANEVLLDRTKYQYSWSFFGLLLSASFYFLFGVHLLMKTILERYDIIKKDNKISLLLLFSIFSSGILYYVLGRFTMSHAFEFCAVSGFIYFLHKLQNSLHNQVINYKIVMIVFNIAIFSSLIVMTRPANIFMLAIPLILINGVKPAFTYNQSTKKSENKFVFFSLCSASIGFGLILVFFFNFLLYGYVWPSAEFLYNGDMLEGKGLPSGLLNTSIMYMERIPSLLILFFSSEVGIFFTMPILFWGVCSGVFNLFFNQMSWFSKVLYLLGGIIVFSVPFAIALLWQTTASDYNYRYLMGLIPISVLLVSETIEIISRYNLIFKVILFCLTISFAFSFLCFLFYKSSPSLFPTPQLNAFGVFHGASLNGYVINVIDNILELKSWIAALGKGLPSIIILPIIPENIALDYLPKVFYENYYPRFKQMPMIIYGQIFILAAFWWHYMNIMKKMILIKHI